MEPLALTNSQARDFLLRKQGLLGTPLFMGSSGVCAFIQQAGCIQYDPIDVCGKNAELVLQSRVPDFTKEMLDKLLYTDRVLVDAFDKNLSIYGVADWPCFARLRQRYGCRFPILDRVHSCTASPLDDMAASIRCAFDTREFLTARDLPNKESVPWGWGPTSLARATLETLYFGGDLVIHHKKGAIKYYGLAERLLDPALLAAEDPHPLEHDFLKWRVLRRIGSVGMLWNKPSDAWLMIHELKGACRDAVFADLLAEGSILPCRVEGIHGLLYFSATDASLMAEVLSGATYSGRLEFLAPLDNLLWDRKLIRALFGFDYKWEIYTPVVDRRHGYYVLPVLFGNRLVGRIEPVLDKKAHRLKVAAYWPEKDSLLDAAFEAALHERIHRFAAFNGCTYRKARIPIGNDALRPM